MQQKGEVFIGDLLPQEIFPPSQNIAFLSTATGKVFTVPLKNEGQFRKPRRKTTSISPKKEHPICIIKCLDRKMSPMELNENSRAIKDSTGFNEQFIFNDQDSLNINVKGDDSNKNLIKLNDSMKNDEDQNSPKSNYRFPNQFQQDSPKQTNVMANAFKLYLNRKNDQKPCETQSILIIKSQKNTGSKKKSCSFFKCF